MIANHLLGITATHPQLSIAATLSRYWPLVLQFLGCLFSNYQLSLSCDFDNYFPSSAQSMTQKHYWSTAIETHQNQVQFSQR